MKAQSQKNCKPSRLLLIIVYEQSTNQLCHKDEAFRIVCILLLLTCVSVPVCVCSAPVSSVEPASLSQGALWFSWGYKPVQLLSRLHRPSAHWPADHTGVLVTNVLPLAGQTNDNSFIFCVNADGHFLFERQVTRLQYLNALMASRVGQSPDPPEIKILPNSQTKLLNDKNTTQGSFAPHAVWPQGSAAPLITNDTKNPPFWDFVLFLIPAFPCLSPAELK